jgi:ribosomal-protein-alanine N-acetyltransferase
VRSCYEIVAAAPNAAAECAALHAELFATPWASTSFERLLAHPAHIAFLARVRSATIGFILGQMAGGEGEILSLAVAAAHQRRGVASALLQTLCASLARSSASRLHCEVAASNAAALGLYHRFGFIECGRRRGYYIARSGAAEDALMLTLALRQGACTGEEVA